MLTHAIAAAEQSRGRISDVQFDRLLEHVARLLSMLDEAVRQNSGAVAESVSAYRATAEVQLMSLQTT